MDDEAEKNDQGDRRRHSTAGSTQERIQERIVVEEIIYVVVPQVKEVTSEVCRSCHRSAFRIAPWSKSLMCQLHRFRRQEEIVEVIRLVLQEH